jgi:hypothetical protein
MLNSSNAHHPNGDANLIQPLFELQMLILQPKDSASNVVKEI